MKTQRNRRRAAPGRLFTRMLLIVLCVSAVASAADRPTRVILFIGDGMGPEHVRAAGMFAGGPMSFEAFEHRAEVTTRSANAEVTDSAASATAIAAGAKVNNGVIALAIPGDGKPLPTILEQLQQRGWATGLVTNDELVGATPASFAAHTPLRRNARDIVRDYLTKTRPDVLLGGGGGGLKPEAFAEAGYTVVTDVASLNKAIADAPTRLCGVFGNERFPYRYHDEQRTDRRAYGVTHPPLEDMTAAALRVLERDPDGLFVMVESAMTDKSGHASNTKNDTDRTGCNVFGTITLSRAVQAAIDWAKERDDVLIVVTSDHETGGMQIVEESKPGVIPHVKWSHKSHTAANVYVWAKGPGAERFTEAMDNTDIYRILAELTGVGAESTEAATR